MRLLRTFTTLLIILIFLTQLVFGPTVVYAQSGPQVPTELEYLPPLDSGGSDIFSSILRGSLNLAVCSGGSLTDRMKAAGQGAINAAIFGAADAGMKALERWAENSDNQKWLQDLIVGVGLEAVPVVGGLLSGLLGGLLGTSSGGPQLVTAPELENKDNCLDAMARATSHEILGYVANGVLTWVQGGFDGQPGFISDVDQYIRGIADREFRNFMVKFMNSKAYGDICDAMSDDIAAAISRNYYAKHPESTGVSIPNLQELIIATQQEQCGLDVALGGGADNFISGSVPADSWASWNELVRNNPYYRYTVAANDLNSGIAIAQNQSMNELAWSGGFISWKTCVDWAERSGDFWIDELGHAIATIQQHPDTGNPPCIKEEIQTPGSVVQDMINQVISSDIRRGELADEFNEVVADAGSWLISNITRDGLRTSSPGLVMNGGSLDRIIEEQRSRNFLQRVSEQIRIEQAFLENLTPLVTVLESQEVKNLLQGINQCSVNSLPSDAKTRAHRIDTFLYSELGEYTNLRKKIDWNGNEFAWKNFVIQREEPFLIDWNGRAYPELQDKIDRLLASGKQYIFPSDDLPIVHRPSDDQVIREFEVGVPQICNTGNRNRGAGDKNGKSYRLAFEGPSIFSNSDSRFWQEYSAYEPYTLFGSPTPNTSGFSIINALWRKIQERYNEAYRDQMNLTRPVPFPEKYLTVWILERCIADENSNDPQIRDRTTSGGWNMSAWSEQDRYGVLQCRFSSGNRCIFPAYSPYKVQMLDQVTYREVNGSLVPSSCTQPTDVGSHFFVVNGENYWRERKCVTTSSTTRGQVQWEDQVNLLGNEYIIDDSNGISVPPVEKLLLNTRFYMRDIDPVRVGVQAGPAPVYGASTNENPLVIQQELIANLLDVARLLESGNYEQAYIDYSALTDKLHSETDIQNLRTQIAFVKTEITSLLTIFIQSGCSGSVNQNAITTLLEELTPSATEAPVKISWNGDEMEWSMGVKYGANGSAVANPTCSVSNQEGTYYSIYKRGEEYSEVWEEYKCTQQRLTNFEWELEKTYPAWELYSAQ